jgi:hypothetical protein
MVPTWLAALIFFSMLGLIVLSQVFWFWRAHRFLRARRPVWLRWVVAIPVYLWFAGILGLFLLVPLRWFWLRDSPVLVTLLWQIRQSALLLPMGLWITASMFSFLLVVFVRSTAWLVRLFRRTGKRGATDDVAVERRYFLQTATYAAGALPFVMVGYGFLIGRQNYQVHEVEGTPWKALWPNWRGWRGTTGALAVWAITKSTPGPARRPRIFLRSVGSGFCAVKTQGSRSTAPE